MNLISPLDDRYSKMLTDIAGPKDRWIIQMKFEYDWARYMLRLLCPGKKKKILPFNITEEMYSTFLKIEKEKKHDVKAIELTVAKYFFPNHPEVVHIFLTSEDANAFGNAGVMLKNHALIMEELDSVRTVLLDLASDCDYDVLARTHGQPAGVTSYKRRFETYMAELGRMMSALVPPNHVKLGGGIGDLDAMRTVFPSMDCHDVVRKFLEDHDLRRDEFTMQTSLYNYYSEYFDALSRICIFMTKVYYDIWDGCSRDHFDIVVETETVGSSYFSNKINPANVEAGIGNLKTASAMFRHLSSTLPTFRNERDLTDSTQLRNIPVAQAHMILALKISLRDLCIIGPSKYLQSGKEVKCCAHTYSAVIQTALRVLILTRKDVKVNFDPYDVLRVGTQGKKKMTKQEMWDLCSPLFEPFGEKKILAGILRVNVFNTSNKGKMSELSRMFETRDLVFEKIDLAEPDASPDTIVSHKAFSAYSKVGVSVIVEDTSLDIEGRCGVNIRWLMDSLDSEVGNDAKFTVKIGEYDSDNDCVKVYTGTVHGTICKPSGSGGFGFDPYFVPNGESVSLAESKPDYSNARWLAVQAYLAGEYDHVAPVKEWNGEWQ